jgi:N-acetylmuramoyl-L-alanine amidase
MPPKRNFVIFLAAALLLWSLPGAARISLAEPRRLQVSFEGDPVAYTISAVERNRVLYVSLEEFADVLGFNRYTNPQNRKTVLRVGSRAVKVSPFNPFLTVDDAAVQMAASTCEEDEKLYIPVALFLDALGGDFPFQFDLQQEKGTLRLWKSRYSITGFDADAKGNGIVIRLHTTKAFSPSDIAVSMNQGWLHVTLYGGTVDTLKMVSEAVPGVFKKMVSYQFENSAQISFKFDREIKDKKVTPEDGAVQISIWTSDKLQNAAVSLPTGVKTRWLIDTIVIDPGHGGRDPGSIGRTGLKEKEVNLEIAFRLRNALGKHLSQTKILLTRSSDRFIGLKERTQFANANGGKLFISIHANANENRSVRGFSTYFLGVGKTPQAVEVAQKENSVIQYEDAPEAYEEYQDYDYILNSIALSSYLKESQDLATMINESMSRYTKLTDQGVHQQGFYVLIGASMPSVLIEPAFLSNANEERLLKTNSFQQKVVEALVESIMKFKERYEKEIG